MYTLKSFNTGQITLPKARRSKFATKNFIAEEQEDGLLIKPLLADNNAKDDLVYYENDEWFGLYSKSGIDPDELINHIKLLQNG